MDFKIATALNLPAELVWFSRQSYAEELLSSSSSSSSTDCGLDDLPCLYGGHFPEMPHDLGSDGTQSPGRDDSDDEAESSGDDYTHALYAQEQLLMEDADSSFEFGVDKTDRSLSYQPSSPRPTSCLPPASSPPSSPDQRLSAVLEISYTPSPSATVPSPSPQPELMVVPSPVPMETLQAPVVISQLHDLGARRSVSVAPWQRAVLREAHGRDGSRPGRAQLRELAQRTHLPVSVVSWWFVEQRRISFHRAKFGFCFTGPASRPSRTIKISATDRYSRH
ncbi:uncharacterized protein LOC119740294 [Patiria miniata]|uniref:Homeobox domain-containing protein n=1 Tax=Patiria miniata TaxID=46514 RepID=A0A914B5W0_PATMI|nr:uncharacterized protein LOC119740294 [Patiria miniata]